MNNKEKYQQAFSVLHASREITLEETSMNTKTAKRALRPAFVVAISAAALFGCMATAYATDLGGIQEKVRIWLGGESVEVQMVQNADAGLGGYDLIGEDGEVIMSGGGIAIETDGTERPLTLEEAVNQLNHCVDQDEDGTIWLYDGDNKYDITELMADGSCNVVVTAKDGSSAYYEIEGNDAGGYGFSCNTEPQLPAEEYVAL